MNIREGFGAPVRLLALFIPLTAVILAAIGWEGWRLIQQNRVLEAHQLRERLDNAATLLTGELERELTGWDDLLDAAAQGKTVSLPEGAVLLVFDSHGIVGHQGLPLPYYSHLAPRPQAPSAIFAAAEDAEFRQGNLEKAEGFYRDLTSTKDPRTRATALMRLARCLRKQGQFKEALATYGELAGMGETPVTGDPSELVARAERITLLKTTGDGNAATSETGSLTTALMEGRYLIDKTTYNFYTDYARVPSPPPSSLRLQAAIDALWQQWERQPGGRLTASIDGIGLVSVWRRTPVGGAAILADVDVLADPVARVAENVQVHLALEDPAERASWGALPKGAARGVESVRETGLPWKVHVINADLTAGDADLFRSNLALAGFGFMVLVIAGATYFVFRSVSQELRVARLQSDFVSAVSHEFRTPLTAMCHLTEMLEEGGTPQDRLQKYYSALGKETRRLHAMVESLLDFKRMEAGRRTYHMEDVNAAELAKGVVNELRGDAGHRIEIDAPSSAAIRADREALGLALRNLVDNAIKYSPESTTVMVSVQSKNGWTAISVQDEGVGIPLREQRDVFRKFVRGSSAKTLHVKGTGIGLAMAAQIVKAHGGRIELTSEPGQGCRFTILLAGPTKTESKKTL